jgi:hypothetical protein
MGENPRGKTTVKKTNRSSLDSRAGHVRATFTTSPVHVALRSALGLNWQRTNPRTREARPRLPRETPPNCPQCRIFASALSGTQ